MRTTRTPTPMKAIAATPTPARMPSEASAPAAIDAERILLGSLLVNPPLAALILPGLDLEWLYERKHRLIYLVLRQAYEAGQLPDRGEVERRLRAVSLLQEAGGRAYLQSLEREAGPRQGDLGEARARIRRAYLLRRLIEAASHLLRDAYAGALEPEELLCGFLTGALKHDCGAGPASRAPYRN
jgi:replicative DNA helicase